MALALFVFGFALAAAAVWLAGIRLSDATDVLTRRPHGRAALSSAAAVGRFGPDSLVVVALCALGVAGLAFVAQ